jgi:SAM-dependent methyltransferase
MPSELAAERGEPSYVWRSGQERRLRLVETWAAPHNAHILDAGTGVGVYAAQFRQRFSPNVDAFEVEPERAAVAQRQVPRAVVAVAEHLPYPADAFDVVFSSDVIEHVQDDQRAALEMVRVARVGGRILIFTPNRWWPFETHGHYWRGKYHFGNTPLINYLPDALRNRLAPHVRTYTARGLRRLFAGQPVRVVAHKRIAPGLDNVARRFPALAGVVRAVLFLLENTPLSVLSYSHFLVLEKTAAGDMLRA